MPVIDIHTHSLSDNWLKLVREKGRPELDIGKNAKGGEFLVEFGTPSMAFHKAMFDYEQRIRDMDAEAIDVSVVSLTSPNAFWGTEEISTECARIMNDDMAAAQRYTPTASAFSRLYPGNFLKRQLGSWSVLSNSALSVS